MSSKAFIWGFSLAILFGIPLGAFMGWRRRAEYTLDPLLTALYASPLVALAPLMIVVFGVGLLAKAMLVFLLSVFPFIFNTFAGVRSTDRLLINVVRSFGGKEKDLYLKVIFPSTLPYIAAGARIALGRGLVGIIVGEFYAASEGIGFAISRFGDTYKLPEMFAGILVLMIGAVLMTEGMKKARGACSRPGELRRKADESSGSFLSRARALFIGMGVYPYPDLGVGIASSLSRATQRSLALFTTLPGSSSRFINWSLKTKFSITSMSARSSFFLASPSPSPLACRWDSSLGRSKIIDAMVDPYVTVFNATPRLIFLPLFITLVRYRHVVEGDDRFCRRGISLLINTQEGVKNVDRVLVNVVRSFGANEWQVMKTVVLPNSVPYIIVGLRLAIGRAVLGVVVGEFFGASEGLGYMIASAASNYKVDVVFVGVAIFMGLSLALTMLVKKLESHLSRWRPEEIKTF